MITTDEYTIAEGNIALGVKRWALLDAGMSNAICAEMHPGVDLRPPPRAQLCARDRSEVAVDHIGKCRNHQVLAGWCITRRHVAHYGGVEHGAFARAIQDDQP